MIFFVVAAINKKYKFLKRINERGLVLYYFIRKLS